MLRRLSILSFCFLLFLALFALTAEGQSTTRTYHIGIPQTLENGEQNPDYPNGMVASNGSDYYFDSLQSLKDYVSQYNFIQYNGAGTIIELKLYSDQQIPNDTGDFYTIALLDSGTKKVRISSADGTLKKITTPEGKPANADFLRIESRSGYQVNLEIDENISIRAGSATISNRYATSILGGDFTAKGVTYQDGGQIYVANTENLHSVVDLTGATFVGNVVSSTENNGAILSLNNIVSANLSNTNFNNNDADWQVYVFTNVPTYSNIRLGAVKAGTESVLGSTTDNSGGIFLGGTGSASYTVDISGDGNFRQNQKIETNNVNFLTVNKTGLGTWFVAERITNKFHAQENATLNINAGTLDMGGNSKIELHGGNNTYLYLRDNSILNMGDAAVFEVQGASASLSLSNNGTLNTGSNSKIDIRGTNSAELNLTDSTLNLNNNTGVEISGTTTNFELNDSTVTAGENITFNINGTGSTDLTWNSSTVKIGNNSELNVKGSDVSFTMNNGTWETGENVQYIAHSSGDNTLDLSDNNNVVNMGKKSGFSLTDASSKSFNGNVSLNNAKIILNGENTIKANQLSIYSTTFDFDNNALKNDQGLSIPALTLNVSTINSGNTTFDIHGIHSNVNNQELIRNTGTATFNVNDYNALLDGVDIGNNNLRQNVTITADKNNKSLYLTVDFENHILQWTGNAYPNTWNLEDNNYNWYYEKQTLNLGDQYVATGYVFNDAVVFDDALVSSNNNTIEISNSIYLSQQTDFLTDRTIPWTQEIVTEYGMRISGTKSWIFNGGSISDDFNPNPVPTMPDQRKHVARLTFDGTGTIQINNENANKFHDGLLIGNSVTDGSLIQLNVARPDSLGSGEYAGEETDLSTQNGNYVVQHEGYGIMFVGNGANIQIYDANKIDDIFDQRIKVEQKSTGTLNIENTERETIVTASSSYYKNKDNFDTVITHGGVIVVENDASFTMTGNFHFKDNNNFINETNFDGGVLWAGTGAGVMIRGNSYSYNAASNNGGAIYFSGGKNTESNKVATLNASNSNFKSNEAKNGGAIYVKNNANLYLEQSAFNNNEATVSGGAVYLSPNGIGTTININNTSFNNNLTLSNNSQGGAIYAGGTGITVNGTGSSFEYNMVGEILVGDDGNIIEPAKGKGYQGGAIYLGDNGTLNMSSSLFEYNQVNTKKTDSSGGAIYTGTGAKINLSNGRLEKNSAYADGGAIYSVSEDGNTSVGNLIIDGTNFIANFSETANGGAIFTGDTVIHGEGTTFSQNQAAKNGGALYVNHANKDTFVININNSQFDQNTAQKGGAIYLNATGVYKEKDSPENYQLVLDVSGTQFLTNTANNGGAIYANSYTTVNAKNTTNLRPTVFGVYTGETENIDPDNLNNDYGNIALQNGGAIYINGEVDKKATSQLNVDGAYFTNNFAGMDGNGNGGAVYLHYADAEIANATFYNNIATDFGGGIYYENENEKELTLQNVGMVFNTAISGGAVYAASQTKLYDNNSSFSANEATQDGGAIYFKSEQSLLDITGTQFLNNIAAGNGGAVYLQNNSVIKTNGAVFSSNPDEINAVANATNGGAIRIGNASELYLSGTTFSGNTAEQNGGAIWINDTRTNLKTSDKMNILKIDASSFSNNEALEGHGGAVYAKNAQIISKGVTFSGNNAEQNGGALYAENSDLNLTNTNFNYNKAEKGGAIYFLTTNNQDREITLETTASIVSSFIGNTSGSNANSIYFDVQGSEITKINLNIETDGILNMNDPMSVNNSKQNSDPNIVNLDLDIVKTGSGKWSLGGINNFSNTKTGTTVDVQSGIFELQNGSELLLTNADKSDRFDLKGGATFATSGPLNSSVISNLKTTSLDFAAGSKMQLGGNLTLDIGNDYTIASVLSGNGGFIKNDNNKLTFTGTTNNYNGNVMIKDGRFEVVEKSGVAGSGSFVTENGDFVMKTGTELLLHADLNRPSLVAKTVSIDQVHLDISGISSNDDQKEFILIHTTNGISGNFKTVDDGSNNTFTNIDYLTFDLGFLNDRKDYGGTIGLRWYSKNDDIDASGQFTIDEGNYFNVGVELHDNNNNLAADWSGTALDKYGLGTLELSATNAYSGKTTIHAGELLLTNKQGTGLGNAVVEVQKNARLGLNFDGVYNKTITGAGQVVQYGGTVELAGNNNYTGGTLLKGGVTEFTAENQFGTGTIIFDGGILRNKAETTLKRTLLIKDGQTAQFDTPLFSNSSEASLTFKGTISGNGGLEKTGNGILSLTGKNTFMETTLVRNGGLNIEGSVQSDVRVQPFAAVSGSGYIIGINEENDNDQKYENDQFHTNGDLFIAANGYFDWYFSPTQSESQPLNVNGSIYLDEGAIFRPRTNSTNFTNQIDNWTVLTYNKTLGGQFLAIDDTFNAFYNFELDYSVPGEIRVSGELLSRPRAMGDVIATGLSIANRKLYRKAFTELFRETTYSKTAVRNIIDNGNNGGNGYSSVRGQAISPKRSVWFTPSARANKFASTFVGGTYNFEAYGMQAGSTLRSNNNSSLGLMIGYERGSLSNRLDWIRSHDYQIGLYFGHIFRNGTEFRSFIGGGLQTFTASRNDMVETYMTKYDGSSFEINAELGKLLVSQNGTLLRPYFAADIEYSGQTAAQESEIGNAFRHYGRADLSQFFVRFGADAEKRWQFVDINGGISYTGLLFGQTRAQTPIFYPTRGAGTTSYGARLGRSSVTLKTGLNWHLNRQRVNTVFLDYLADIYLDRAGRVGDNIQHSGNLGILVRF
ncbi:MAG: hypothetical protein LBG58_01160 [Planctomycetaceae bacterium]|jgi:autotransporter-associated beta strand protein/predicted outer membrane repeat protein|nr:hypothetical protein [Planctomycetaceae bacterium]